MLMSQQPNIVWILTDQQSFDALSCVAGERWLKTPHLDALAAGGVRFDRGDFREMLFDLNADPHETRNLARDPAYAVILETHRGYLADFQARVRSQTKCQQECPRVED